MDNVNTSTQLPTVISDVLIKQLEKILERKMVKRQGIVETQFFVQWVNQGEEEATWEFFYELQKKYPTFEPCGQGSSNKEDLL